jgi:4-hydroxy-tetrahydrodipicolinate reductase
MGPEDTRAPLIRAVLISVTGRMGQALLRAAPGFAQLIVTGAIAPPQSLALGRDAGEVAGVAHANLAVSSDLPRALAQADVALDFSSPAATAANLAACRAAHVPLLIGTTAYAAQLEAQFTAASREVALLIAPNTSLGVTLLLELTARAARALPAEFDIGIFEAHHRLKRDAPSGTALALGRAAREARLAASPTAGSGEGEIGIASLRGGDLVGEHTVLFAGPGEQLSLTHRATDRGVFARGALAAALWLASRPPGRYTMRDFLVGKTGS